MHVINEGRPDDVLPDDSELQEICDHMNEKKRVRNTTLTHNYMLIHHCMFPLTACSHYFIITVQAAQSAQLSSTALFQGLYFLNDSRAGTITEAIVYNIRANGVMAYSPRYCISMYIPVLSLISYAADMVYNLQFILKIRVDD